MSTRRFFDRLFEKDRMRALYPHHDPILQAYLRDIHLLPVLKPEQELRLLLRAVLGKDDARQQLVEANLRLVITIASYFQGRGLSIMDLIQEGNLGLHEAIQRFDFTKSTRLSTYAKYKIVQAISRAVAEQGTLIHTPYATAQRMQKIDRVLSTLIEQDIEPTPGRIAASTGLSVEQVRELRVLMQQPVSLERAGKKHAHHPLLVAAPPLVLSNTVSLPSRLPDVQQIMRQVLTPIECQVIEHRFGLSEGTISSYWEIAEQLFHRHDARADDYVRQIEKRAIRKLQAAFAREEASGDG
jgi:RNA polymerase primary sigma factor